MEQNTRYHIGDKIAGRYEIHHIRMGGMGVVYFCLDVHELIPLALKTFHPRYLENPRKLQKALNEVSIWVKLAAHPNIVRCFFMDYLDGQPFMALEWIAEEPGMGVDLRSWLRRGALNLRIALNFTIDICRGLCHAQTQQPGFVHRDLTPRNILIAQGGLAKITDFGLAGVFGAHAGRTEKGAGTPPYIPPEQWQGLPLDERADIYAIGCMLFEMLTGEKAFRVAGDAPSGRAWEDAMRALHHRESRPTLPDSFPSDVRALVMACLAVNRDDRPPTVSVLLERLTESYRRLFSSPLKPLPPSGEFSATDFNNRGVTYLHLKKPNEALEDFNRALNLAPRDPQIRLNRARVCLDLWHVWGDERWVAAALADCEWALAVDDGLAAAYICRGTIFADTGQLDTALADFERAITLQPDDAAGYAQRGVVFAAQEDFSRAVADFDRALALDAGDADTLFNRGVAKHNLGQYGEAVADFLRVLALDAADVRASAAAALSLVMQGETESAMPHLAHASDSADEAVQMIVAQVRALLPSD